MEMSDSRRAETGAFYTPKMWADFCVERLRQVLPTFDGFTFYDPAAGEGALLDALPPGTDCYGTTLERGDVEILRRKGYEAEVFDFLTMNTRFLPDNILAASEEGRLVVLTNPPYFKLPANRYHCMKRHYPAHCADSVCLFLLRIVRELQPCVLAAWTKLDLYQALLLKPFRDEFDPYGRTLMSPAMTPSRSWGLRGNFPIVFSVWHGLYYGESATIKNPPKSVPLTVNSQLSIFN